MRTSLITVFALGLTVASGAAVAQSTVDPYAPAPPAAAAATWNNNPPNSAGVIAPAAVDPNAPVYDPNAPAPAYDPNAQPATPYEGDETIVDESADTATDDGWQPEAYNDFQGALSPYGTWVNDPTYGEVWQPSSDQVGYDFSPYASGGNWSYTEYGWTWVSDYSWGWAPFHYGRWFWGNSGWCWRPGRTWGPGWVSWRSGGGYAGWAPLGPRGTRYVAPPPGRAAWHFTQSSQLGGSHLALVSNSVAHSVFRQTRGFANLQTVGGARWNMGPQAAQLGRPIAQTSIRQLPAHTVWPRASVQTPLRAATTLNSYPRAAQPASAYAARPGYPQVARPVYSQPSYARPAYAQPAYQRPAYQQPSYAQPAYAHPAYQQPTYSRPYQQPSYQQPAYSHPSYQQPTYSHPSYQAPSYSHPSYSAPSHFSSPSPSFSRPSSSGFHSSGGGFHGGGRR